MKNKAVLIVVVLSMLFFGCGSSKQPLVSNPALDTMITKKEFEIAITAVEPQVTMALSQLGASGMIRPGSTIGRIDVDGEGYFIRIEGQNVSASLPYYGERQMGGGYGSDTGIIFEGTARELTITKDEEKQRYVANFSIDNTSESYSFTMDLSSSLHSTVHVRSSHRNRIRYIGKVRELGVVDSVSK